MGVDNKCRVVCVLPRHGHPGSVAANFWYLGTVDVSFFWRWCERGVQTGCWNGEILLRSGLDNVRERQEICACDVL